MNLFKRNTYAVTIHGPWEARLQLPGGEALTVTDGQEAGPQECITAKARTGRGAVRAAKRRYRKHRPGNPISHTVADRVSNWTDADWLAHGFIPTDRVDPALLADPAAALREHLAERAA